MAHSITVLLGPQSVLREVAEADEVHEPVQAKAGVWLLPLTEEAIDRMVGLPVGSALPGFKYLFPKLVSKLKRASTRGWIVYAETDYFGGNGVQGSATFDRGDVVYGPRAAETNCINAALASVGLEVVPPARDEYETVGLADHRFTEDWIPDEDGDA